MSNDQSNGKYTNDTEQPSQIILAEAPTVSVASPMQDTVVSSTVTCTNSPSYSVENSFSFKKEPSYKIWDKTMKKLLKGNYKKSASSISKPTENCCSWQSEFTLIIQQLSGIIRSTSDKLFTKSFAIYIENITKDALMWNTNFSKLAEIKKDISNTLFFYHFWWKTYREKNFNDKFYLQKMSNLLEIFVNLELILSEKNSTPINKIASVILNNIFIYLGNSEEHILKVLLKIDHNTEQNKKVCSVIFNKYFSCIIETLKLKKPAYVHYILALKLWRSFNDEKDRKEINRLALKVLNFENITLYEDVLQCFPLLQNSFDVVFTIESFLKYQEEIDNKNVSVDLDILELYANCCHLCIQKNIFPSPIKLTKIKRLKGIEKPQVMKTQAVNSNKLENTQKSNEQTINKEIATTSIKCTQTIKEEKTSKEFSTDLVEGIKKKDEKSEETSFTDSISREEKRKKKNEKIRTLWSNYYYHKILIHRIKKPNQSSSVDNDSNKTLDNNSSTVNLPVSDKETEKSSESNTVKLSNANCDKPSCSDVLLSSNPNCISENSNIARIETCTDFFNDISGVDLDTDFLNNSEFQMPDVSFLADYDVDVRCRRVPVFEPVCDLSSIIGDENLEAIDPRLTKKNFTKLLSNTSEEFHAHQPESVDQKFSANGTLKEDKKQGKRPATTLQLEESPKRKLKAPEVNIPINRDESPSKSENKKKLKESLQMPLSVQLTSPRKTSRKFRCQIANLADFLNCTEERKNVLTLFDESLTYHGHESSHYLIYLLFKKGCLYKHYSKNTDFQEKIGIPKSNLVSFSSPEFQLTPEVINSQLSKDYQQCDLIIFFAEDIKFVSNWIKQTDSRVYIIRKKNQMTHITLSALDINTVEEIKMLNVKSYDRFTKLLIEKSGWKEEFTELLENKKHANKKSTN